MTMASSRLKVSTLIWGLGWSLAVLLAAVAALESSAWSAVPALLIAAAIVGTGMALGWVVLHHASSADSPGDRSLGLGLRFLQLLVALTGAAALVDLALRSSGWLSPVLIGSALALALWSLNLSVRTSRLLVAQKIAWPLRLLFIVPWAVLLFLMYQTETSSVRSTTDAALSEAHQAPAASARDLPGLTDAGPRQPFTHPAKQGGDDH